MLPGVKPMRYRMPTLSLNLIAEMLHINASYLSRTFKTESKTGISEYINRYRIRQAQDMLLITLLSRRLLSVADLTTTLTFFAFLSKLQA